MLLSISSRTSTTLAARRSAPACPHPKSHPHKLISCLPSPGACEQLDTFRSSNTQLSLPASLLFLYNTTLALCKTFTLLQQHPQRSLSINKARLSPRSTKKCSSHSRQAALVGRKGSLIHDAESGVPSTPPHPPFQVYSWLSNSAVYSTAFYIAMATGCRV